MLGSVNLFFLYFFKLVSACLADRAGLRRGISLMYITAYFANPFCHFEILL